ANIVKNLQDAEQYITENRYDQETGAQLAQDIEYQIRHALFLSQWIGTLQPSSENWEGLILQFEQYLSQISATLDLQSKFDQDFSLPVETIQAALRSLLEDRRYLQRKLKERDQQIGELEAEVQKLRSETGKYVTELEQKREELQRKKRVEEKVQRIAALFTTSEGIVLQTTTNGKDQVILRLIGLKFASGSSEIRPEDFSLLSRVQQAIQEFPNCRIELQGHTDSQGGEAANLELSKKRADSVRKYLIKNLQLEEDRITAVGYGEDKPVASNDTATGRAQNRRIDVIITP
ncbi:MAG: OmpA family protein, partial [bacterium]